MQITHPLVVVAFAGWTQAGRSAIGAKWCRRQRVNEHILTPLFVLSGMAELGVLTDVDGMTVLGVVHGRCGDAYLALRKCEHALIMYDRQLSLAEGAKHMPGVVSALEGQARCVVSNS